MIPPGSEPAPIRDVMAVDIALQKGEVQVYKGTLRYSPAAVYGSLRQSFSKRIVPLLQEDDDSGAAIVLLPRRVELEALEPTAKMWVHWVLFFLTLVTTTWAGALHQAGEVLNAADVAAGLPYSFGLLSILGVHELGHYFTALRNRMKVTPPYFIPVPFALGTFGAFIKLQSPPENRSALFDVAVAGPLAGFIIAVPALVVGLQESVVLSGPHLEGAQGGTSFASSIMFALLAKLSLGSRIHEGYLVQLNALAFAGWLGLIVTALNLIPVGQLDGGHIARAMFGRQNGERIGKIAMASLFLLALFVWPGLLVWAFVVFFIASRPATPPLNDISRISPGRWWLGVLSFVILAAIMTPVPVGVFHRAFMHCPYL